MKSYVFPGDIEEDILRISGQPFPYMRTRLFSELVKDSEQLLLSLIGCPNGRVIPYTDGQVCRRMIDAAARYIEQHGVPRERTLNIWRKYTSIKTFGRIKK